MITSSILKTCGRGYITVEVVADSEEEAIEEARRRENLPDLFEYEVVGVKGQPDVAGEGG